MMSMNQRKNIRNPEPPQKPQRVDDMMLEEVKAKVMMGLLVDREPTVSYCDLAEHTWDRNQWTTLD